MLLNILRGTGEPPRQNPPAPDVNRNPGLERLTHLQPIFTTTVSALVYPFGQGFPNLAARWNPLGIFKKYFGTGLPLVVQWLRLQATSAGAPALIPGRELDPACRNEDQVLPWWSNG